MATPRNGFVASRHLSGGRASLKTYPVKADANNAFAIGDPVVLRSDGTVAPVTAAVSANFLGVIQGLYRTNSANERIELTFNQPSTGNYLVTGQAGFAQVNVDPDQLYIVQLDVTASVGLVGNTVHVSAAAPASTGISRYSLAGTTLGTDAERPFKIIGIAPTELINKLGGDFAPGSGVEVKLNGGSFRSTTGV